MDLKDVQTELIKIPDLNQGGCGISALAMYKALKDSDDNIGFVFMYKKLNAEVFNHNETILGGVSQLPKAPNHVGILYKGELIDSNGKIDLKKYSLIQFVDYKFLIDAINNSDSWNEVFDRRKADLIEEKLGVKLIIGK